MFDLSPVLSHFGSAMQIITKTKDLEALCKTLSKQAFITIDTEFIREKTYFSKLCLIQIAGKKEEAIIDPLAEGLNLTALFDLMLNKKVLKVFHAAYQDMEIFYHMMQGKIPAPIFDTQIAAMVCGLGDNVGYAKLVQHYCDITLDKNSRYTDWARRPLSDKQLTYAIADVTYLYQIYQKMTKELEASGRLDWVKEDMNTLQSADTYAITPRDMWQKIKFRSGKPQALAIMREIAAWREERAVELDKPRPRILRDDAIIEIATHPPKSAKDLEKMRGLTADFAHGKLGKAILACVEKALNTPKEQWPRLENRKAPLNTAEAKMDILRLALKLRAREHGIVPRLICSDQDLTNLINRNENTPLHKGWRWDLFGKDAAGLLDGTEAIAIKNGKIAFVKTKDNLTY